MGKKRIAIIGDVEAEEALRLERELKREQKKLREQAAQPPVPAETPAPEKFAKPKKEAPKPPEKIRVAGQKGGERVKSLESAVEAEADIVAQKLKEAEAAARGKKEPLKKAAPPKKRGKNYLSAKIKLDPTRRYPIDEAVRLLKDMPSPRFIPTVELHVNCLTKLNSQTTLPYLVGKSKQAAVADDATIGRITAGQIDFDVLFASPEQMPKLVSLAKVLGPKGLMPNPKSGTVVTDPKKAAAEFTTSSKVTLKTESSAPVLHTVVGKLTQPETELTANTQAILEAIRSQNIKSAYLKSTMSPSIKLDIAK